MRPTFNLHIGAGICALALCTLSVSGAGKEKAWWPNYRGPAYDGAAAEALTGKPHLKQLWQASVGTGFSAITVVDDRCYTMGNKNNMDTVYCFDTKTGKKKWEFGYPCPLMPKYFEGGPGATPTIHDGRVYTLSRAGHIYCLDAKNGREIWKRHADEFRASPPTWGYTGSVTVLGDSCFYNIGKHGVALNRKTGATVWQTAGTAAGYATPMPYMLKDKVGISIFNKNGLTGRDPLTGKAEWNVIWKTEYDVNAAEPIFFDNKVFISSGYNKGASVFDLTSGEVARKVWQNKVMRNQFQSSIYHKGYIYGIDGSTGKRVSLSCIKAADGKLAWKEKDFGFATLLRAGERLVILRENGEIVVIEADHKRYKEVYRQNFLRGRCWTVPTFCQGQLYGRNSKGDVVCAQLTGN